MTPFPTPTKFTCQKIFTSWEEFPNTILTMYNKIIYGYYLGIRYQYTENEHCRQTQDIIHII